ncbi:translocation/assembly module TamB domain-containing protein [Sphingomonas yantingensis]|uniref:Translocation and assembly module TamB n=1 Tax=Sphingomonas yantingensis TaxID=1241761 RepID=A0A7W9ARU9_9SPHN|nr:translocation and assembly module TamB [Sphingomonas yantingensis]
MPPPAKSPRRWWRWLLGLVAVLVLAIGAALLLIDTQPGHRFIADRIAALAPRDGMKYRVGRIEGSIYGRATLIDVTIRDPKGLVFSAPRAELDWRPLAWGRNTLDIRSLIVPAATLHKLPQPNPTGRRGPILPGFDIRVGLLRVERLELTPAVAGQRRVATLIGRGDVRDRRALIDLAALVQGSDFVRLKLDAAPDRDRFDLAARGRGRGDGVLARMIGTRTPVGFAVAGDGSWSRWRGSARADVGAARIVDLKLGVDAGRYALDGNLAPASLLKGRLKRLSQPRIRVAGQATLADRRLNGTLSLRTAALAIDSKGGVDLATSGWRNLVTEIRLLRPPALFPNMTGRNIRARVTLDGAFDRASFDYRLTADRAAFDQTGFEVVRAAGRGRLSKAPVTVPLTLTAARVTGVGDVAGGILRNLTVSGPLKVTSTALTADALQVRSDQLNGRVMLLVDLRTGRYEVGLAGGLKRYRIPGLGLVEVDTKLSVVPGANGVGTRIVGTGTARMLTLENAFFRSLTQGLPRIVTRLERGPDRILRFTDLRLTSPGLNLRGNGYRRIDGTFVFAGQGVSRQYGPVVLSIDGRIDRPVIRLRLARPQETLGLTDVTAALDPVAEGYRYTAAGGSRLGPFTAGGTILLPRGGQARIVIDRLDVAGARGQGALDILPGGFLGAIDLTGGGLSGRIGFAPEGEIQRIDGDLTAQGATISGARIRSGRLRFTVRLDPAGTDLAAETQIRGLSRGALSLARLGGSVVLRDGSGSGKVSLAGSRGRRFALDFDLGVTPDRYTLSGGGQVDGRPLKLLSSAELTRTVEGWALAPTKLSFAGGEAQLSGRFGDALAIDAGLTRMPLGVLDIGYPGLGLGGSASGKLSYSSAPGAAPTGSIDMTVRGLSRAGLVLSTTPIDMGLRGILRADQAGFRAVMASGGRVVGRAQARMAPLGGGTLAERLSNAPLFAQLRYGGPADTLWRLTGIELFDLSGPVQIGADVTGRLADPRIRGLVRSDNARIASGVMGTVLTGVKTAGRFDGSRLVIERFEASDGKAGTITGSGAFDLAAARGFGMDLKLEAKNALVINRDDIGASVSGPVTIRSDGAGGTIAGEVTLNSSRYRLGRATAAAAIPRLNITEINLPEGDEEVRATTPWQLDLRARAPGGMKVTGLGLDSEWSADLRIDGEPTNPRIRGRADLVRGDYEFAGRDFDLERGAIRFDGSVPANPALDIQANADTQGLNATIRVTGTALKPEISFSSVPALPEDELLSRLLFGTSITSLSAPEALQLAGAVAALQEGGDGLNPINALRRAAGLDRLRILSADPQTGQQTAIAAGKFITRRAYVEIISDGAGYSATRAEFQFTRWLSVLSTISTIGRQSVNVRISRDY